MRSNTPPPDITRHIGRPEIKKNYLCLKRVEKSNYFRRDGADVHTDAEISLSQAILGGTIRVQGVYEDQSIQVTA